MVFLSIIVVDFLINFNTAFFDNDKLIVRKYFIFKKYISTYFIFDIISISSVIYKLFYFTEDEYFYNPNNDFSLYLMNSLLFLKGFDITNKKLQFEWVITLKSYQKHILKLLDLIILIIFVAHIVSIIWHEIAIYELVNNY